MPTQVKLPIENHKVHFTFFEDAYATRKTEADLTLPELAEKILGATSYTKDGLPWLKAAEFGDERTSKKSLRNDKNMGWVYGIELDYDKGQVSFQDAVSLLEDHGVRGLVHTSRSHTPENPRWRQIIPLSKKIRPDQRQTIARRVAEEFGVPFDEKSFIPPSQSFFYGSVTGNPPVQVQVVDGRFADEVFSNPFADYGNQFVPKEDWENKIANAVIGADFNNTLTSVVASMHHHGLTEEKAVVEFFELAQNRPDVGEWNWAEEEQRVRRAWQSAAEKYPRDVVIGSVIAPINSEIALALQFADQHGGYVRHVAKWGQWVLYDGKKWNEDETRTVFGLSQDLCRKAANATNKAGERKALASAKTRAAVLSLASDDPKLAAKIDQWDLDPWLLNTPDGAVDLRTNVIGPHRTEDYMRKITAVSPDPSCPIPLWTSLLEKVTQGDSAYQRYLARMSGYALTGSVREHALFFLHGHGGNGKGTFLNTVANIMGDYHSVAPMETFIASQFDRHPTDLAGLAGARLVTATETEEGRRWAESKIKALTGGDPITARFMRQDFFKYMPQFKLIILGNHRPGLQSVDESIRRRMHLLPFKFTVSKAEKDTALDEKLKREWPGILSWMIDGCLEWQQTGLQPPHAVTEATEEYLNEEDALTKWMEESYGREPNGFVTVAELFGSWSTWASANGEEEGSSKRFSQRLVAMGFRPDRRKEGGRGFKGLKSVRYMAPKNHFIIFGEMALGPWPDDWGTPATDVTH